MRARGSGAGRPGALCRGLPGSVGSLGGATPTPQSCQAPAPVAAAHFQPGDSALVLPQPHAHPCASSSGAGCGRVGSSSRSPRRTRVPPHPASAGLGPILPGGFAPGSCRGLPSRGVRESVSFKPSPASTLRLVLALALLAGGIPASADGGFFTLWAEFLPFAPRCPFQPPSQSLFLPGSVGSSARARRVAVAALHLPALPFRPPAPSTMA